MYTRNTKQKSIIIDTLKEDKTHPTIKQLYSNVNKKSQTLGQATVYRTVNKLLSDGKIKKIVDINGLDHYDADCNPHYHLECKKCHRIIDIYDNRYERVIKDIERKYFVKIDNSNIVFEGVCKSCNEEI